MSVPRERKRCPAARARCSWSCLIDGCSPKSARLLGRLGCRQGSRPNEQSRRRVRDCQPAAALAHDGGAGPSGSGGGLRIAPRSSDYLDTLRGDAATRPIWALSRSLVGVVDEPRSMARTFVALAATCRRARDLCTPGLRAYLVWGMAHALACGGVFLKGKRAGTLVASLIKHTTHSPPERLGLVPLLICDETVEVLLPLLRCTDWIDRSGGRWYSRSLYCLPVLLL